MQRLTEGGAYSKNNNLDMNYFSSEDKINKATNYSQSIIVLFFILQNHKLRTLNLTTLKVRLSFFEEMNKILTWSVSTKS